MFSSYFPWQFSLKHPNLIDIEKKGLYAFSCYDPYLEKLFLNSIPRNVHPSDKWKVLAPEELTISWIENNILAQDFFLGEQKIKVLNAQEISTDVQDFIQERDFDWGENTCLLLFRKDNKFLEKIKKDKSSIVYKIKEPRFWEGPELLNYLCDITKVSLKNNVKNYILENIANTPKDFIIALKELRFTNVDPYKLSVNDVDKILKKNKLDFFHQAKLWGEKNEKLFFEKILIVSGRDVSFIKFFNSMQSHIIKVLSAKSFLKNKVKMSQYDNLILTHSRTWQEKDLLRELSFFGKCELEAKKNPQELLHLLRKKTLLKRR